MSMASRARLRLMDAANRAITARERHDYVAMADYRTQADDWRIALRAAT